MPLGCEMRQNQERRGNVPHSCDLTPSLPSTACAFQRFFFFFLNGEILPLKCTDTLSDTDTHKRKSSILSRRQFYLKAWAGLTGGFERWEELRFLVGHS